MDGLFKNLDSFMSVLHTSALDVTVLFSVGVKPLCLVLISCKPFLVHGENNASL